LVEDERPCQDHDYLIISDFYGKILKKLDVLEADLGPTAEIAALRAGNLRAES